MSKLSPIFNSAQLIDGIPASGAKLFTYAAGSSTKQTAYTDKDGAVAQSNPIILNSRGEPDSPIWLTEGLNYKFVLAPADDTDPPSSPIRTVDDVSGTNDASVSLSQWVDSGDTPSYVNATQFTVPGDRTSDYHVNRRVKLSVTAGTVYGKITTSAYTSLTTVTVELDSGSLDAGLSAVQLGLLTQTNPSYVPVGYAETAGTDFTGAVSFSEDVTFTNATLKLAKGADVASATALPLITDGNYFDVTGTDPIETMNSLGVGTVIRLHFDDVLTLTHHATNLILPTGANITTAAGDEAEFIEYASGDWRCVAYQKADGRPLVDLSGITIGSESSTVSGTEVNYSVDSVTKRITMILTDVSFSGTGSIFFRVEEDSSEVSSGYSASGGQFAGTSGATTSTTEFIFATSMSAAQLFTGRAVFSRKHPTSNHWYFEFLGKQGGAMHFGSGYIELTNALTGVILKTSGTAFDGGVVNVTEE